MSVTKSGKDQASKLEAARRVRRASDLLLTGLSSRKVNNILQSEFGIGYEQCKDYIAQAEKEFFEENPVDKQKLRSKVQSMYFDLYNKSYAQEHYKTCREILDSVVKTGGLLVPDSEIDSQKIQVTYSVIKKEKE